MGERGQLGWIGSTVVALCGAGQGHCPPWEHHSSTPVLEFPLLRNKCVAMMHPKKMFEVTVTNANQVG